MKTNSLSSIILFTASATAFNIFHPHSANAVTITDEESPLRIDLQSETGDFTVFRFENPENHSDEEITSDDPIPRSRKSRLFLQSMANYQSGKRVSTKDFYNLDPSNNRDQRVRTEKEPYYETTTLSLDGNSFIRNEPFGKNNGAIFGFTVDGIHTMEDPGNSKKITTMHFQTGIKWGTSIGTKPIIESQSVSHLFRLSLNSIFDLNVGIRPGPHLMFGPDLSADITANSRGTNNTNLNAYAGFGTGFRVSQQGHSFILFGSAGKMSARNQFLVPETLETGKNSPHELLPDSHQNDEEFLKYPGVNAFSSGNAGKASLQYKRNKNLSVNASWIAIPRKWNPDTNNPLQIIDLVIVWNARGSFGLKGTLNHLSIDTKNPDGLLNPASYDVHGDVLNGWSESATSNHPKWTKTKIESDMSHFSDQPVKIPDALKTTTFTLGVVYFIER
jgi:hypothetical protein